MPRFRRFGRAQPTRADDHDPWLDDPPPAPATRAVPPADAPPPSRPLSGPPSRPASGGSPFDGPPAAGSGDPAADVVPDPATRAARPALWTPRRPEPDVVDDPLDAGPVTDPFGFPPVPPVVRAATGPPEPSSWAAWAPAPGADATDTASASPGVTGPLGAGAGWGSAIPGDGWAAWSVPVEEPAAAPVGNGRGPDAPSPAAPAARAAQAAPAAPAGSETAGPDATPPPDRSSAPGAAPPTAAPDTPAFPSPRTGLERVDDPPGPDPAEAAALAAAFAADYLSWDEDDPERRGRVLAGYLAGPRTDRALLGWSGQGRQRTEMVLPGRVRPDRDGRVVVDLRVRVTPYRRVDQRGAARTETDPDDALGEPAAAPPATARGWRGLASRWVRLGVAIAFDGDELVVDAGEEPLHDTPASAPTAAARPDPTLDGDDDPPSPLSLAARRGGAR